MTLGLALAASLPAQEKEQTGAEKLGWQIAVHSYSFKEFSFDDAIAKTREVGLNRMSISGSINLHGTKKAAIKTPSLSDKDLAIVKEKLQKGGIVEPFVNMGVVPLTTNEAQDRQVFEFAKKAGIPILVSEPAIEALDLVEKLCKEYNIKVALHNHPEGHSIYWNPEFAMSQITNRSPLIGICADTGHWVRSGLDPVECLKKCAGRILVLHFKDLNEKAGKGKKPHDVPWGTGISNARAMMEELKRQNFHGAFCIEYENNWTTSVPEIAECVKFFNKTTDELAKEK